MQSENGPSSSPLVSFSNDIVDVPELLKAAHPAAALLVDRDGIVTGASGRMTFRDGRHPIECIGSGLASLICPGDADRGRTLVEQAFSSSGPVTVEDGDEARVIAWTMHHLAGPGGGALAVSVQDLTGLRRTGLGMKDEQLFMHAVLESIPGAFTVTDLQGRLVRWNGYHRDELVGKPEEEMLGSGAFDVIHPDDREFALQKTIDVLINGVEDGGEARVLKRGGPDFCWRKITGRRIDVAGQPMVVGVSFDITDRKQAEEALRQSEERFRAFFEKHSAIMLIIDGDSGAIVDANEAAADYYGASIEELRSMLADQLAAYPEELAALRSSLEQKESSTIMLHLLRKDGSVRETEMFVNRIEIGEASYIYAIIHDVTDRKRWERLAEFRLRLYQLAENSTSRDIVLEALDEAGRLTGSHLGVFLFPDGDADADSGLQEVLSRSASDPAPSTTGPVHDAAAIARYRFEAVSRKQTIIDNSPSLAGFSRILAVPVIRGDEVPAVFVLAGKRYPYDGEDALRIEALADITWDIVARKQAEQSESRVQSVLMQIQKMELVGQLAGGIAHDFNNMLSVIIGNTELALESGRLEPLVDTSLHEILAAAGRSAILTNQLLAFARKQPAMPKILDLNTAVEGTISMLRRLIGEDVRLTWTPGFDESPVRIDPSQLDQILTNLCVNARDAIAGNGSVSICVGSRMVDHTTYEQGAYQAAGEYVELTVSDDGCGIDRKNLNHIFEPFFTTKEQGKGTGLGLSTVYGIVKQNGGFIELDSEKDKGTVIRIMLPRHRMPGSSGTGARPGHSGGAGSETVLLVEDEPDLLSICTQMLENRNFNVLAASSPQEALTIAAEHAGTIDLLLTDVVMPEMNGRDLSEKIITVRPGIRTVYMSAYTAGMLGDHELMEGVNFIHKPFSLKELASLIFRVLHDPD